MNQLYTPARQKFLNAGISWDTSDIRLVLLNGDYTFDAGHEFLSDIAPATRVADADIHTETSVEGYAQGQPALFLNLVSAVPVVACALYVNTGDEATSSLVAFYDVVDGFPFTPTGLDYFVSQDIVFGGFFRI